MRISTFPSDPGYKAWCRGYQGCKVTLDGVEINRAFVADEDVGVVVRAALDADGRTRINGDEVMAETLYGKVRIIKP